MSTKRGFLIGLETINQTPVVSIKATGKLTHEDYELLNPVIDSALREFKGSKLKVLLDATEFEGWELKAAWDDFKIGLKHGKDFEKIAIIGNKKWQEYATKISSWFTSGEVKFFDTYEDAIRWLI